MTRSRLAAWEIREVLLPIAAVFVISRIALLAIGAVAARNLAASHEIDASWFAQLCRFDCGWYLSIVEHGYSTQDMPDQPGATNYSFYPLFPWLVRALAQPWGGHYFPIALVLNNVCFFAALTYVYRYARLIGAEHVAALLAVTLLCVLPQSIAFSAVLTESLFLLFLVLSMYYLRRERFLLAGLCAALLSATRANGILYVFFALVWIVRHCGVSAFYAPWRRPEIFVPVVLAPLGMFVFWAYCFYATGDAFAHPSTELYGWGWRFAAPWENLPMMLHLKGRIAIAAILSIGVFLSAFLLLRQRLYEDFAVCAALILLMWCSEGNVSVFRYLLVLFPVWIGVARVLAPYPIASATTMAVAGSVNGLMMCAWTLGNYLAL